MNGEIILGVLSGIVGFLSATGVVGVIKNIIEKKKKFKNDYKQIMNDLEEVRRIKYDTTKIIIDNMEHEWLKTEKMLKESNLDKQEKEYIRKRFEDYSKSMETILKQLNEDTKKNI